MRRLALVVGRDEVVHEVDEGRRCDPFASVLRPRDDKAEFAPSLVPVTLGRRRRDDERQRPVAHVLVPVLVLRLLIVVLPCDRRPLVRRRSLVRHLDRPDVPPLARLAEADDLDPLGVGLLERGEDVADAVVRVVRVVDGTGAEGLKRSRREVGEDCGGEGARVRGRAGGGGEVVGEGRGGQALRRVGLDAGDEARD